MKPTSNDGVQFRGVGRSDPPPALLSAGEIIDDRYEIVALLEEVGTASVYLARHLPLQRLVAVKVVHLGARGVMKGERFDLQLRATASIRSKYVAELCDAGELPNRDRYLVLEYLRGETLGARLERVGRMSPAASFALGLQLTKGLAAAHRVGVVHCDIQPSNLFLIARPDGSEWLKIFDFGVVHGVASAVAPLGLVGRRPFYLAPELALGSRKEDPRTDVYSAGAVLYRMLTGEQPHPARNVPELIWLLRHRPTRPLRQLRPDVPPDVEAIVHEALALRPEDRYPTAEAFAKTLARWLGQAVDHEPPTERLPFDNKTFSETEVELEIEWSDDDEHTTARVELPRELRGPGRRVAISEGA